MQVPLRIQYRHCDASDALDARVREKADELERFFPRITGLAVTIEGPSAHHRKGKGAHFHVRIDLTVPGDILIVGHDAAKRIAHEDPFRSVDDAFHLMRRRLEDHARERRGDVKTHVEPMHGRVIRLAPDESFGFLEAADGREIYFHRNSVFGVSFDELPVGAEVRFSEEEGEKGPQATTVTPVAQTGHHELPPA